MISSSKSFRRTGALLLVGTVLGGSAAPLFAQDARQPPSRNRARRDRQPPGSRAGPSRAGPSARSRSRATSGSSRKRFALTPTLRPGQTYTTEHARSGAEGPLRDPAVRRRHDQRRRHRRPGHRGPRKPGHQPHHPRGQQAPQGRQDHAGDQARAAPDLHPIGGPRRRRPDPRALSPAGPLRRARRAEDRPARPEPRRRRVRDLRGRPRQGPRDQHHRQQAISATAPAQGNVHAPGGRHARLPQVERHLRSRPARRRPAEAARLLPDRRAMPISASSRRSPS